MVTVVITVPFVSLCNFFVTNLKLPSAIFSLVKNGIAVLACHVLCSLGQH